MARPPAARYKRPAHRPFARGGTDLTRPGQVKESDERPHAASLEGRARREERCAFRARSEPQLCSRSVVDCEGRVKDQPALRGEEAEGGVDRL